MKQERHLYFLTFTTSDACFKRLKGLISKIFIDTQGGIHNIYGQLRGERGYMSYVVKVSTKKELEICPRDLWVAPNTFQIILIRKFISILIHCIT